MFGWRRKSDGFEWHEYVRTTIKLRREDRRKRLEDIRLSAVEGAKNAGSAGARAGRSAAGRALSALGQLPGWIARTFAALGRGLAPLGGGLSKGVKAGFAPLLPALGRPGIAQLLGLIALAAMASAIARWSTLSPPNPLDWQALSATAFAIIAGLLVLISMFNGERRSASDTPAGGRKFTLSLPAGVGRAAAIAAIAIVCLGTAAAGAWYWAPSLSLKQAATTVASITSGSRETVEGRARAITGDTLLVAGNYIRLEHIEAPELAQRCRDSRRRQWRCGRAAKSALARLTGRQQVSCETKGGARIKTGSCRINDRDIAEQLVKAGHVFAAGGLYSRYGAAQQSARNSGVGIWRGNAQKPAEYRSAMWDQASKRAPDGCPIKGHVSSRGKIYFVPWSPRYRRERIDERRGERWFCSESDALAAGWRPDPAG